MATETSTSTNSAANYPPPGFNPKEAQKPLSKEGQQTPKEKTTSSELPDVSVPKDGPTSHPKTKATEAQSLTELAAEKAAAEAKDEKTALTKKEEKEQLTLWQKVKKEVHHYWDGTKLLVAEVKISSKLALKMAAGYELTRREHRQVCAYPVRFEGTLLTRLLS
jgi:LETM1 and EF-hand domain-containing protein 1